MKSLKEFKSYLKECLTKHNIDSCEAEEILCSVLQVNKTSLFLTESITGGQIKKAKKILAARIKGMPIEKYLHKAFFYGLSFYVDKNVLTPRQDSEIVVENCIKLLKEGDKVLDLCTGSGALGISLLKHCDISVWASDISKKAIKVAQKNAKQNKVKIHFVLSDLFENIDTSFDLIVCNPPYIKTNDLIQLQTEVKDFDPICALDGGLDGLHFYKKIAAKAGQHLNKNAYLVLEIGYNQAVQVKNILTDSNYKNIKILKDYGGNDRVIVCQRGE